MVARRQIEFIWNCKLSALANTRKPTTMPTLGRAYLASFLFQTEAGLPKKAVHVLQQEELGKGWAHERKRGEENQAYDQQSRNTQGGAETVRSPT